MVDIKENKHPMREGTMNRSKIEILHTLVRETVTAKVIIEQKIVRD